MNDLHQAMQLVDECTDILPEGTYMKLCTHLKNAYNHLTEPVYFFEHGNVVEHFRGRSIQLDRDFIYGQLIYLEKELENHQPIQRITKNIKEQVSFYYNVDETEFQPKAFNDLCKSFMNEENTFRELYRDAIIKRIEWLEQSLDSLS